MITAIGQVMLYVNDQEKALDFWVNTLGFVVVSDDDNKEGMRWIEVAPSHESETSFVLHNKELVRKMNPDMNLGTPSIMFFTDEIENLKSKLEASGHPTGPLVDLPFGKGRVFNFADKEENYFAVKEVRR